MNLRCRLQGGKLKNILMYRTCKVKINIKINRDSFIPHYFGSVKFEPVAEVGNKFEIITSSICLILSNRFRTSRSLLLRSLLMFCTAAVSRACIFTFCSPRHIARLNP